MPLSRAFTATAFVVWRQQTLLHFHAKYQMWLPPGGHVEANETPNEAVVRETLEETGVPITLLGTVALPDQANQLVPPRGLQLEPIPQKSSPTQQHEHVDFIYFARPAEGYDGALVGDGSSFAWYTAEALADLALTDEVAQWCALLFEEWGHL